MASALTGSCGIIVLMASLFASPVYCSIYNGSGIMFPSAAEFFPADRLKISEPPDTEAYRTFYAQ
eukprot:4805718-Pyramimonas_sp.AAC.1